MRQSIDLNPQAPGDPMSKKITKKKFSYIKAVEFKNFMTSMAPAVLRPPTLSVSEYDHLMELVEALRILDSGVIKITDIDVVHNLLLNFAKKYEQEYEDYSVPPNFHFMLHLRDCMRRWGPISCFWAFSFERNNLFVKRVKTNHKQGLEKTYIRKMQAIIFADDANITSQYGST